MTKYDIPGACNSTQNYGIDFIIFAMFLQITLATSVEHWVLDKMLFHSKIKPLDGEVLESLAEELLRVK